MSQKVKIELNSGGIRSLLRSSEMMSCVVGIAEEMAQRAGNGYEVSKYVGAGRVNASVRTDTTDAYQDNLDNNTLLKAMR